MDINKTATLRLHLWELHDIGESPQSVAKQIKPENAIDSAWIPQTMGDQVWLWFEFATVEEKEGFLKSLPQKYLSIKGFVADNFTQKDIDHWTK